MAKKKAPKRVIYCECCGHPGDILDDDGRCTAKTVKGAQCKCPRLVRPEGGSLASFTQYIKRESHRSGKAPPPAEGAVV